MENKFIKVIINIIKIVCFLLLVLVGIVVVDCTIGTNISGNIVSFIANAGQKVTGGELVEDVQIPDIIQSTLSKIEGSQVEYNEVDYSNVVVDKHFYNQLDDESKIIYKAFESNKENMKTGTFTIELGTSFSNILSNENGQDELGKYYQSAIEAYTYDNPDVFYLNAQKMYLNIETTRGKKVTYNVFINSGNEENYLTNEFNNKEEIDEAIKKLNNVRQAVIQNKQETTYDNIKMVHDYLVDTIEYDSSATKNNIYNIYGALITNECVCEGYAKSFKYLMDALNIPCTLVIGKGKNSLGEIENHAWNYVQIEDTWYAVDCTWDDPVIIGFGSIDKSRKYKYFLIGENEMKKDHMPSGQFTKSGKEFEYPTLSTENYK